MQTNIYKTIPQFERSALPSMTQPDQTYTMSELLKRHQMGVLTDTDIQREGVFNGGDHDDIDLEKFGNLDLVDKAEYMDEFSQRIKTNDAEYKAAMATAAKEKAVKDAADRKEREEFEAFKAAKNTPQ